MANMPALLVFLTRSHADLAAAVSNELVSLKAELQAQKAEVESMKAEADRAMQVRSRPCRSAWQTTHVLAAV